MPEDTAILPSSDGHHDRADMAMVWKAVQKGWRIPDEWKDTLPTVAAKIAADPSKSDRDRLRALELLNKLDDANFAKLLEAAKRSDDGAERHKVEVVYVNRPRSGDDGRTDTTARVLSVVEQPALPSPERSGNGDDYGA